MPEGVVGRDRLEAAYATARQALLDELVPAGHWEGELSTSALSTATAVMALEMIRRRGRDSFECRSLPDLIANGLNWLAKHQNDDGGWGDTVLSISNISTTMLGRAVFVATGQTAAYQTVVDGASRYIERVGGVKAVVARYGKDRTFSVPILTHCALAGEVEWSEVIPLPFELACAPPRFYKTIRLPVVSYALPALIAIGQVRHHFRPTRNPITRLLRGLAKQPSLRVLERIQPTNGGFLEAAPLTSFVTMSLAAMDLVDHPVTQRGLRFIVQSVRDDGSWPIDTNLATWVTTLAVSALGDDLPDDTRKPIVNWLLNQQYTSVHPYTNAAPGGWAWTDLPGGVPDADDTPGAILALFTLTGESICTEKQRLEAIAHAGDPDVAVGIAVKRGLRWLLDIQNRDGGFPTFCRGWGKLPFDRSSPDLTAHALRSMLRIESRGGSDVPDHIRTIVERGHPGVKFRLSPQHEYFFLFERHRAMGAGFRYLKRVQRDDGSWLPLWFGNQHAVDDENPTYGTARVLAAYRDAGTIDIPPAQRGFQWLRNAQNEDGGWGAGPGTPATVEETALAVDVLLSDPGSHEAAGGGLTWLVERVEDGSWRQPAPIGFYFARLWYFERLYPLIFTVGALRQGRRDTT